MPTSKTAGDLIYLDTSGLIACLDADDRCHEMAAKAWAAALESGLKFLLTDWVRLECWSLLQRRLGVEALNDFYELVLPRCKVDFVDEQRFDLLARQSLLLRRRDLSLVDLSSFDSMRQHGIKRAIAFDSHFAEQGFVTPELPAWR